MEIKKLINFLKQSFKGDEKVLEKVLAVWISGGHLLLNDRPGTGKTTLANSLARAIDVDFKRIQFNPDLTPSDVTGVNTFNQETRRWEFHKGPVFSKVVLADEINRAPPRTQSALLEAMGEHQVSVDGITHALNKNFFVIATQNPLDSEGTYPLPEAENDRFAMMLSLGYLNENDELDIILGRYKPVEDLKPIFNEDEWIKIKYEASSIEVPESVARDVIRLINETRNNEKIINGASVRGGIALINIAKALAYIRGDEKVYPDHIYDIAVDVLAHRIKIRSEEYYSGETPEKIIQDIIDKIAPNSVKKEKNKS